MIISDHLDMVGVELRHTWTQTRKVNGDLIQSRVANTINPWKAGKFMPVTMRPWSINSYGLSKAWFKCHSVDLRVGDVGAITKCVKSWIYADMFEKPAEDIMFRPASYGGLGVISPKYRALACLIRSFLETAVNPSFRRNYYHDQLFRYHILAETDLPNPSYPPYYPAEFFSTILHVKESTPELNITTMTTSEWTKVLVEEHVTMTTQPDNTKTFTPCRAELAHPGNNWALTWQYARLKGLGPEHTSFLWKLIHQLLPVKARLHRISPTTSPLCTLCTDNAEEDMDHAFNSCSFNQGAGVTLTRVIREELPETNSEEILRLGFPEMDEDVSFAVVWFTAAYLLAVWNGRLSNTSIRKYQIRSEIESKVSLLRETSFSSHIQMLKLLCENITII